MRILFLSAELAPLAQSGGLGDAAGGLARALAARGHELVCALPAYRAALAHSQCPALAEAGAVELALPERTLRGRWLKGALRLGAERLDLRLLDLPELYDRDGLYGDADGPYVDEALRFASFARAGAALAVELGVDVLVAHDWHAGLAPCVLREVHGDAARGIAAVQVVHNGAYQGRYPASALAVTGLGLEHFHMHGLEFYGDLCMLKGGLVWADRVVAVSPTYARELRTPGFGAGLEGLYVWRGDALDGIANGIDTERFDPARDAALPHAFDARRPAGKQVCRDALVAEFGLAAPVAGRLVCAIGRFAWQKGWDVLAEAVEPLVATGASLVLLGSGDAAIAERLDELARQHARRVGLFVGWDERLSRRVYAGADVVLVPSRYEPCGLVQLLAQRYGALPVAHAVGGLVDTIDDGRTGVLFDALEPDALVAACARAARLFEERGAAALRADLLALDVSWRVPAARWEELLRETVEARRVAS
ncbi:MAG: glycogen/starch synthase [Planctomycetes bacterium]|nr:glycogen/starch synthase [Planctomycetota bacterium]